MTWFGLIILVALVLVLLWFFNRWVAIDQGVKNIIIAVVLLILIVVVVGLFIGGWGGLMNTRVGRG